MFPWFVKIRGIMIYNTDKPDAPLLDRFHRYQIFFLRHSGYSIW